MKAMLLAAGRGTRLLPLTEQVPKPLLKIGDDYLIEKHLRMLKQQGFCEIVINASYHAEQLMNTIGDGTRYGVHIIWSDETGQNLETGGGILNALSLLGEGPFLVINSDIYTDWQAHTKTLQPSQLAHLILVENPTHHPQGDFFLDPEGQVTTVQSGRSDHRLTFAGIGYYRPALLYLAENKQFGLASVLRTAMDQSKVSGEVYAGKWEDIGTPQRLGAIRKHASQGRQG